MPVLPRTRLISASAAACRPLGGVMSSGPSLTTASAEPPSASKYWSSRDSTTAFAGERTPSTTPLSAQFQREVATAVSSASWPQTRCTYWPLTGWQAGSLPFSTSVTTSWVCTSMRRTAEVHPVYWENRTASPSGVQAGS